jgi:hypothetical protein
MKKIPTMFERDWLGDKSRVIDEIHHGCEWVSSGEGEATRKIDGTSCLVRAGKLYKRRELRAGDLWPAGFEVSDKDEETKKTIGWIPVGNGPEDKWHRMAFERQASLPDGTYELVGPKIQGNPENFSEHILISHNETALHPSAPRTFEGLREWFQAYDIEGLVFHHPDGRMAKIKKKDFGLKRK